MLAGLALGLPAYVVGMLHRAERRLPPKVVMAIGAMSGFLAGSAVLAGWASWAATVAVGALVALIAAVMLPLSTKALDALPPRWRR